MQNKWLKATTLWKNFNEKEAEESPYVEKVVYIHLPHIVSIRDVIDVEFENTIASHQRRKSIITMTDGEELFLKPTKEEVLEFIFGTTEGGTTIDLPDPTPTEPILKMTL